MSTGTDDLDILPVLPELPGSDVVPGSADQDSSLQQILSALPAEDQLAIMHKALRFGVRDPADPMFQFMVALAYYQRSYEEVPLKIQEILSNVRGMSDAAVTSIATAMDDSMRHMLVIRDSFKSDISEHMAAQKRDFELTRTKAVASFATDGQTKEALQKMTLAAARGIGIGYAARWVGITVVAVLIAVVGAYVAGRTHVDPAAQIARDYYDQLTCRPNGAQRICALTVDPKQVVVFQEPR